MSAAADREVEALVPELRPGLRSCASGPPKSTEHADDDRLSKDELEKLLAGAGLGGPRQGRETARVLKCDEKSLRRFRHPLCGLDLAPPEFRTILKGRIAERERDRERRQRRDDRRSA